MNRRYFLGSLGAAASARALSAQRSAQQNVLFIAIDDLNDWIGCLGGHPDTKTPNLDRLAARGTLFTSAHCAAPLCNPSRAALMTGIRPSTSGIYTNSQPPRQSPVLKNAVSLTQHFMANGYRAVGGGKIYHGSFPDPQSWQEYFPSQTQNKPPDPHPAKLPANGIPRTAQFDWGPLTEPDSRMGDHQVVDWAASELRKKQDKPLFLACGIFRPHLPWYVPQKYFDYFPLGKITLPTIKEDDLDDVPPLGRKMAKPEGDHKSVMDHNLWRQAVQAYLASIAFADAQIGRLLDAFDASPYAKNTTIVLWSDHGWHLGEKLHWRKFTLWEEATHNVLMVVSPGLTKPGGRCDRPVSLMDIYPTLVDVCGLPRREGLEGASLMPLLRNPKAAWDRPALTTYGRNNHSVRSEQWRYVRYSDGAEELYDRRKDPLEWTNLAARPEHSSVKQDLARWLPKVNAPDSATARGGEGG
jgi:arylsulfatase A-like enzyme